MSTQLFESFVIPEENQEITIKVSTVEDQHEVFDQQNIDLEKECDKSQVGRWNYEEQCQYLQFAKDNMFALQNKENRRSSKVFKQMAKVVITRSADQCRSHHQKMEKKHGSVQNILSQCKRSLERLRNKAKRIAKKNLVTSSSFLQIKESLQKSNFQMKTPMTAEPQYSAQVQVQMQPTEQIQFNDFDDFLCNDKSFQMYIGVDEAQSLCLDFFNYNYDPLF